MFWNVQVVCGYFQSHHPALGDPVKKSEAFIKPFKLDEVKDALPEIGLVGLSSGSTVDSVAREAIPNSIEEARITWISCRNSRLNWLLQTMH